MSVQPFFVLQTVWHVSIKEFCSYIYANPGRKVCHKPTEMYVTSIARKPEEEIEGRLEASSKRQPQVST